MDDLMFRTETGRFLYRVAGVLIHDGRLLIMRDEKVPYYYLPGGKVRLHEGSEEAIKREIKEEIEAEVGIKRLLWVVENFFTEEVNQEPYHEIGLYYLLELQDDSLLERGDEFVMTEQGKHRLSFSWKQLEEIKDVCLYPTFLKERITDLPATIEHLVEYQ
ncbi:NUDIX hydrolase [Bacillus testis]|uniref:NUDIX hydrolase n=1 Tax=Bacillus testis TaxID=1622072 RepID=UPI00067EC195|nr:NUDIX hydrolase [Bacillus testis]